MRLATDVEYHKDVAAGLVAAELEYYPLAGDPKTGEGVVGGRSKGEGVAGGRLAPSTAEETAVLLQQPRTHTDMLRVIMYWMV